MPIKVAAAPKSAMKMLETGIKQHLAAGLVDATLGQVETCGAAPRLPSRARCARRREADRNGGEARRLARTAARSQAVVGQRRAGDHARGAEIRQCLARAACRGLGEGDAAAEGEPRGEDRSRACAAAHSRSLLHGAVAAQQRRKAGSLRPDRTLSAEPQAEHGLQRERAARCTDARSPQAARGAAGCWRLTWRCVRLQVGRRRCSVPRGGIEPPTP